MVVTTTGVVVGTADDVHTPQDDDFTGTGVVAGVVAGTGADGDH